MKKPLVERFITNRRIKEEETIARLKRDPRLNDITFAQNLHFTRAYTATQLNAVERARKYRLTESAEAMIETLRPHPLLTEPHDFMLLAQIAEGKRPLDPDIETPIISGPDTPIWIELAAPLFTGGNERGEHQDIAAVLFFSTDYETEELLKKPQPAGIRSVLERAKRQSGQDYQWPVFFIDSEGNPRDMYFYMEQAQTWLIRSGEECPTGECTLKSVEDLTRHAPGATIDVKVPCKFCATILAYWRSWIMTALLVVAGEFAATEEAQWPQQTEHTTRKVQRIGSKKYDEIQIKHDYYVVSFDASVRKTRPVIPLEQEGREVAHRGSWVAQAAQIDPDRVIYMRHDFGQSQRRLDPERNPRWKSKRVIDVRSHARRVPMRVDTVQKRITRVIASKYQNRQESQDDPIS